MSWPEWTSPDGKIRLINADCLEVLPHVQADAVVTDPPWNCGYFGPGDDLPWAEYRELLAGWLKSFEALCDGQCWFLSTKSIAHVADLFQDYRPFASAKNFSQMMESVLPNCWDIAFIRDTQRAYRGNGRNWFVANTSGMLKHRTEHPTPRTADVMEYIVGMFSWPTILDPFAGSCTTAIACIRTDRRCICIEKEPKYFQIGIDRVKREYARTVLFNEQEACA